MWSCGGSWEYGIKLSYYINCDDFLDHKKRLLASQKVGYSRMFAVYLECYQYLRLCNVI
jgi:hypothetical protein